MIKEELEKEAEEYLKKKNYTSGYIGYFASGYCKQAYVDSAEPREKRIAELEDKLANADYQLEGRDNEIRELEAQIEKMKCCGNCAKNGHICVAEEMQGKLCGKNKVKWELRS